MRLATVAGVSVTASALEWAIFLGSDASACSASVTAVKVSSIE